MKQSPDERHEGHDATLIGREETLQIAERARKPSGSTVHQVRVTLELTPSSESHNGYVLRDRFVGIQDQHGEVVEGRVVGRAGRLRWQTMVVLIQDPIGTLRRLGATVHGPKHDRFLYLSWPASGDGWGGMRAKIQLRYADPLVPQIVAAQQPSLIADVTDRMPHDRTPVPWEVRDLAT
ncbi:DUF5990 family protein [Microlunatus soli]|uniref:DUF5990 family protein n=1 Tax=Microlunatus soli TaxID=630515 RepID=UPI0012FBE282|nr:DUF5990 family protein [Microlunatus soli]